MAVPTLDAEQYQYEDDGVLLNSDAVLPFFDVSEVLGLDNAPVQVQTVDRQDFDGGYGSAEFEGLRTVTIEGTIYASPTNTETYLDTLKANFAPSRDARPLYLGTDAGTRVLGAKSTGLRYNKNELRRIGSASAQVQFLCEDPRIYTPEEITETADLSEGVIGITIGGNRNTPAVITIAGPATNPAVTYNGTKFAFALTLTAGQSIAIDLLKRTAIQDNGTNRRTDMTITGGLWYFLQPGVNEFVLEGTGSGNVTVTARSAWR